MKTSFGGSLFIFLKIGEIILNIWERSLKVVQQNILKNGQDVSNSR